MNPNNLKLAAVVVEVTSAQDIRNRISALEQEKAALPLPNLDALESAIQFHSARTHSIDKATAAKHVEQLQATLEAQEQGRQNHARHAEIKDELIRLKEDLHWATEHERVGRAEAQNRITNEAYASYIEAQRGVIHAYRRLEAANLQAMTVPGAQPRYVLPRLHLPELYPQTWIGDVGQHLSQGGKLTFEGK